MTDIIYLAITPSASLGPMKVILDIMRVPRIMWETIITDRNQAEMIKNLDSWYHRIYIVSFRPCSG
jgi:hypothetical protein